MSTAAPVQIGPAPPQPTPVPQYGSKFVRRVYQTLKTETSASSGVEFLNSSFGIPGYYYIDKLSVWKVGLNGTGMEAQFNPANAMENNPQPVKVNDFGSGTSLPGVTFKVPVGHAKQLPSTGSTILLSCKPVVGSSTTETFVANLYVWVQI